MLVGTVAAILCMGSNGDRKDGRDSFTPGGLTPSLASSLRHAETYKEELNASCLSDCCFIISTAWGQIES